MEQLDAQDPRTIGPYRLLVRLGAGGTGRVFLGVAPGGALVAVKVVHPGLARDGRFRTRFRREVEVCRRVTGPWVAAVVDADPAAEQPWLATQFVRGPSLATAVAAAGPLPGATVHVLAHGLALALAAIHAAGLVHRNLTPSNVLLDADHPRLTDFGVSRAVDAAQGTSTGTAVGTPAFMSPEQISGAAVGTPSDVFSLGVVLCCAATGRNPFGDAGPAGAQDLEALPEVLHGPVAACLAERPEDRPTADGLARVLAAIPAGGTAWPPPAVTALADDHDRALADVGPARADPAPADAPGPRSPNRRLVLAGVLAVGAAALAGGGALVAGAVDATARPPAPRVRWTVPVGGSGGPGGGWAVDDRSLYRCSEQGVVRAVDVADGAERWSAPGWGRAEGTSAEAALVPVGGSLVVGTSGVVAALDAATGRRVWEVPRRVMNPLVQVVDGTVLATAGGGVVALDAGTGRPVWSSEPQPFDELAQVAAGGRLACWIRYSELIALDVRTGDLRWTRDLGEEAVLGRLVANRDAVFVATRTAVLALEPTGGQVRWRVPLTLWSAAGPARGFDLVGDVLVVQATVPGAGRDVLVHGLDASTGTVRWTVPTAGAAAARLPPVSTEGHVYLSVHEGPTHGYDVTTGALRWSHGTYPYTANPVAARGTDAFLLDFGTLYAVTAP